MTVAAVLDQSVGLVQSILKILGPVHGKDGGELLVGKGFAQVGGRNFADENLGALRHCDPRQSGDGVGGLTNDFCVESAVDDHYGPDLIGFFLVQNVAAPVDKLSFDLVVNAVEHHHTLLRGTDHAVVKGFGVDHRGDGQKNIGGFINDGGGVAGANAQRGLAGGVGGFHHSGAAGGENQVGFLHDLIGQLQGGLVNPSDDPLRGTGGNSGFQHNLRGRNGAALCPGVGTDNNGVAGFQRDQGFENRGGSGIGSGNDRGNHADGLRDFLNAVGGVFFNHAAGSGVLIGVIDVLSGIVVFDDLVFHDAHSGLGNGLLRQGNAHFIGGSCRGKENPVHLFLGIGCKPGLGGSAPAEGFGQFLGICYRRIVLFHIHAPL